MLDVLIFTTVRTSSSHKIFPSVTPRVCKNHVNIMLLCKLTSFMVDNSIKTYAPPWEASEKSLLKFCGVANNIQFKTCNNINVYVALYGYETWSLTLKEEHRLRVFENSEMKNVFRPKGWGVTGGWRQLHIERFHVLLNWQNIIRVIKSRRMRLA
jgi:hypothetical protein